MYEYPSHDTPHKPHDERDSETSSDTTQLYSTNDQVAISDEQQAKRELSIIMEDNEDSTLGGQEMEDIFPELCIESSETQDWSFAKLSGYVAEAVVEHNRLQHKSLPNSKYDLDVDHAFMEDEKQSHRFCEGIKETASDGYIKHPLMQYPSVNPLHVPASSEGKFQVSPNGYVEKSARNGVVSVTGEVVKTDVSACDEYTAKLTMLEPNSFAGVLSATSNGSVQTSPHQTQEKEISEPSAYTLFQLGMHETDMHISPLFKFSTHPKTALRDDSISTNSGTASSGDAKSCVLHLLTSSYGTPTSVDPCSCRNTGNRSVTSSGYVSESSLSMYKHGSSANHSRNIMEMSGYVTESLEPVPTLSLSKHSIIHSKVSIEPSLSTGTPDACVNDDQLTGQPSITPDHLHSEGCNADLEYNKGSKMTPSGYVPYASHDEDATQHPSTPTAAPFTVTYDPSTLTDEASTLRDDPSTLTDDPLTITYDPSDNPSTPTDDTFTLSDDPLTITYDPSTPTDDSLTMTYDSSILTDDPCTLTYVPSTLTDGLLTITYDPSSALADETSTLTNIPSTLTNDPLTTTYDPLSALTDDTSTLTYVPSTLTDDPSTLTDDPSTITDDLALEYALYNIQNNDSTDSSEDGATHNMNVNVLVTGKDFCGSTLHDTASKLNPHLYIREAPYNDSTSHAL
jgi:hypothetical protein